MFLKRTNYLVLVTFLLTVIAEGELLDRLRQRNQIGLERYYSGSNLISERPLCEPMKFSLPKPDTGCCGVHKFDETNCKYLPKVK